MNFGKQKWKRTWANFARMWDNEGDATRCARGHAPRMPTACLLGSSNLFFQKTLIFRKSLQICGQVEAKAKASPYGHATKRLGHVAAKTRTCSQGQGSPMGMQPRPRQPHGHAAKAKACNNQGQGSPPWVGHQGQGMQLPRLVLIPYFVCPWFACQTSKNPKILFPLHGVVRTSRMTWRNPFGH